MPLQARPQSIRKIGLTGGIGSGKSTVGQILREMDGAVLIDADALSRTLTAANGLAIGPIEEQFGSAFLDASGALSRDKMRTLIFSDPRAKEALEAIIHPLVRLRILEEIALAEQSKHELAFIDIPLLAESYARWRNELDAVLVIDCSPGVQIQRVMQRSGLDAQSVLKIINAQASRASRNALARWIILNDTLTLEDLRAQVLAIDYKN